MPLDGDEWVVRSALWPRVIEASSGLISQEQVVSPAGPKTFEDGSSGYAVSVGRLSMLIDDDAVHDYGRRVANAANAFFEQKHNRPPVRPDETVHYRGSYDLGVGPISEVKSEVFLVVVEHFPENGLDEHCDIEFRPKDPNISGNKKKNARTGVIAQLMRLLRNPRPCILPEDDDLRDVLEKIDLGSFVASD